MDDKFWQCEGILIKISFCMLAKKQPIGRGEASDKQTSTDFITKNTL